MRALLFTAVAGSGLRPFAAAETASCPILSHSCFGAGNAQIFGDPVGRLAAVIGAAQTSAVSSVCDADYAPALQGIAQKIIARLL